MVTHDPQRAHEVERAIHALEAVLVERLRTAEDWRASARILGNIVYAATDVFGQDVMVLKLAHRVRRLLDAAELRGCIARQGADLILHGHEHAFSFGEIAGRYGLVPVFGMPSASSLSSREELTAQYCVYEIEGRAGEWRILAERRVFSPASGSFARGARRVVAQQNGVLILSPQNDPATCRKSA